MYFQITKRVEAGSVDEAIKKERKVKPHLVTLEQEDKTEDFVIEGFDTKPKVKRK
jgi:hypothetical protein